MLSRWQNRELGFLQPTDFIDVLIRTGRIAEHDYAVFEKVCSLLECREGSPFDRLFLTCNFTRISVAQPDFAENLNRIAEQHRVQHDRLVVEITENTHTADAISMTESIKKLKAYGFKVAIDDMGAGFSTLEDIYDNETDIIKLERGFLSACMTERRRHMLGDIITLVHNAGAKVVCEGVENAEQKELLKTLGCDMIQGFYVSRVLPLSECESFLTADGEKRV